MANADSFDYVTVQGDGLTVDILVWRRYKRAAYGITELTMDLNPHLAQLHKDNPFLPIGTQVRIPIDAEMIKGTPQAQATVVLWGTAR